MHNPRNGPRGEFGKRIALEEYLYIGLQECAALAEWSTVIIIGCGVIFSKVVYNPLLNAWGVLGTRTATSSFAPFDSIVRKSKHSIQFPDL